MKHIVIAIALLACSFTPAMGRANNQSNKSSSRSETELRQIEADRSKAIKAKDIATLDRIYAEDFSGVAASGRVVNKSQLFEVFKNTDPRLTFTVSELNVRVFRETAVVTGRLTATIETRPLNISRFMHVYVKRRGRWQFVAGQATNIG